jgi:2-iminobutanoate/2-iminopropanoate deaminase
MHQEVAPGQLFTPAARYAHGVLVEGPHRWLHTSGMIAVHADGVVPAGVADQAALIWANLRAVLAEAAMTFEDVVSVTTYVVTEAAQGDGLSQIMAARDRALENRRVASTLLTVPALAQPRWLLEIALVAAGR